MKPKTRREPVTPPSPFSFSIVLPFISSGIPQSFLRHYKPESFTTPALSQPCSSSILNISASDYIPNLILKQGFSPIIYSSYFSCLNLSTSAFLSPTQACQDTTYYHCEHKSYTNYYLYFLVSEGVVLT